MFRVLPVLAAALSSLLKSRTALQLENLALRHQIGVLQRSARKRPKLTAADRVLWAWLCGVRREWRSALVIVKPETVVGWHRAGFRLYWRWRCRPRGGRPKITDEIRALGRRMADENPTWGAPKIHGELLKLGFVVSERTVARCLRRVRRRGEAPQDAVELPDRESPPGIAGQRHGRREHSHRLAGAYRAGSPRVAR